MNKRGQIIEIDQSIGPAPKSNVFWFTCGLILFITVTLLSTFLFSKILSPIEWLYSEENSTMQTWNITTAFVIENVSLDTHAYANQGGLLVVLHNRGNTTIHGFRFTTFGLYGVQAYDDSTQINPSERASILVPLASVGNPITKIEVVPLVTIGNEIVFEYSAMQVYAFPSNMLEFPYATQPPGGGTSGGSTSGGSGGNPLNCLLGEQRICYTGPSETADIGICINGTQICTNDVWSTCIGEITPLSEICNDTFDNDCDGQIDEQNACCNNDAICDSSNGEDAQNCQLDCGLCGNGVCDLGEETQCALDCRFENSYVLSTDDGVVLVFNRTSLNFSNLFIPGTNFSLSSAPQSLRVVLFGPSGNQLLSSSIAPTVSYSYSPTQEILTLTRQNTELKVEEKWIAKSDRIDLQTKITNIGSASEKAIEACARFPVDLLGNKWYNQLNNFETIQNTRKYASNLTRGVDIVLGSTPNIMTSDLTLNLHGVNFIGNDSTGIAIAINPEEPRAYLTKYEGTLKVLDSCFYLGTYATHVRNPNQASFNLTVYAVNDSSFGLRSALQKLYVLFPDSFTSAAGKTGMVVDAVYNYGNANFQDPSVFHIDASWNAFEPQNQQNGINNLFYIWPTGFFDRALSHVNVSSTGPPPPWPQSHINACLDIYEDLENYVFNGGNFPYEQQCQDYFFENCQAINDGANPTYGPINSLVNPGTTYTLQGKLVALYRLPNQQPIQNAYHHNIHGQFRNVKEVFQNSMFRDVNMQYTNAVSAVTADIRQGANKNLTCSFNGLNPDPGLNVIFSNQPSSQPLETVRNFGEMNLEIAKKVHGLYGDNYIFRNYLGLNKFDGAALDTIGVYEHTDYNPEMLEEASFGLSFQRNNGRVVSLEHLGLTAFMNDLRKSLPTDSVFVMNGVPISGSLGQRFDMFTYESDDAYLYDYSFETKLRLMQRIKMVADKRPITFIGRFTRENTEQEVIQKLPDILPFYTSQGAYIYANWYGDQEQPQFIFYNHPAIALDPYYLNHLNVVHSLTQAGWEPVPFATSDNANIGVERFGNNLFTFYNPTTSQITFNAEIRANKIGYVQSPSTVTNFETGQPLAFSYSNGKINIPSISLQQNHVLVIRLT